MQRWESRHRYYQALIQRNLFGEWELLRIWGRKGAALGRQVMTPCASLADADALLNRIAKVRARHGYRLVQ
ncbi:MAG: WGR domain-containing protein [Aquabacterium sp.]